MIHLTEEEVSYSEAHIDHQCEYHRDILPKRPPSRRRPSNGRVQDEFEDEYRGRDDLNCRVDFVYSAELIEVPNNAPKNLQGQDANT